jgi:uncharacterized SAM-binding protein YcdF (DUF218 family)
MKKTKKTLSGKARLFSSLFKIFRFLFGFAATLLLCGFGVFLYHIHRSAPAQPLAKADGIVVLTGKGGGRLAAGARLLKGGYGERLLISGVNTALSEEKIATLLGTELEQVKCCIDLDYEAKNTIENARETAIWARSLGYETIILVTSSYHMPRAKVEINAAISGIHIIPYPVKSTSAAKNSTGKGSGNFNRNLREYAKLLLSYAREPGARFKKNRKDKRKS